MIDLVSCYKFLPKKPRFEAVAGKAEAENEHEKQGYMDLVFFSTNISVNNDSTTTQVYDRSTSHANQHRTYHCRTQH